MKMEGVKAHKGARGHNAAAWIWPFSPETAGEGFPPLPTMSPNEQRIEEGREVVKKQPSWQFVGWKEHGRKEGRKL